MAKVNILASMENYTRFEDADSPAIDINIEIDAGAAEQEAEVEEMEDMTDEATDAAEAAEEATEGEETMQVFLDGLRQFGMTPSMRYVMDRLSVFEACGVVAPAKESLDAHGRNDQYAERLIRAMEAKADSFWEKTKAFIARIWNAIKNAFERAVEFFASYGKAVTRAAKSIKDIDGFDEKVLKDMKYKATEKEILANANNVQQGLDAINSASATDDWTKKFTAESGAKLGLKITTDSDGDAEVEQDKDFFKTREVNLKAEDLAKAKIGGVYYANAAAYVNMIGMKEVKKIQTKAAQVEESISTKAVGTKMSGNKDEIEKLNKAAKTAKKESAAYAKAYAQVVKVAKAGCSEYIRLCAAIRKARDLKAA